MSSHHTIHIMMGGEFTIHTMTIQEERALTSETSQKWMKREGIVKESAPDIPPEAQEYHPSNTETNIIHHHPSLSNWERRKWILKEFTLRPFRQMREDIKNLIQWFR